MPDRVARSARRAGALRIAGIYGTIGALWVAFSDRVAQILAGDAAALTWLQTAKGWVFVAVTAMLIYVLVERGVARAQRLQAKRMASEEERRAAQDALGETRRVFSTLLSILPGMAYRCRNDPQWTMEFLSEGCEALTGYDRSDLLGNATLAYAELIHPDDRDGVWNDVHKALADRRVFQLTYRIQTMDEEEKWVWEQGCGVFGPDGSLLALEGFISDVTDKKRLEAQFLQAQKMESVGRLVGAVAHDFNNVLTAIVGLSQMLLMDGGLEESVRADVEEIHRAGRQAASLTNQLLSFSRKHRGESRVVNLNGVLSEMEGMLRRLVGSEIRVTKSTDPDLGLANVDPGQLQQVIMNLAVNARDAMPEGGTLSLRTSNIELDEAYAASHTGARSGPYVMLEVSDTGVGMDEGTRARVFDPFFTTKEAGKGTGLGLSTVYNIVKESGGNVWVYSAPGEGTTFKVYLPHVDEAGGPLRAPTAEEETMPGGSETILLVEDEETLRVVVRGALESAGYRVLTAGSGEKAQEVARTHGGAIDLLVTDLMLPGITGRELADRLVADGVVANTLFLSGFADEQLVQGGVLAPGAAFLQKPFSARAFLGKVRFVLDAAPGGTESV